MKQDPIESALRALLKAVGKVKPWSDSPREKTYFHAVREAYDRAEYILGQKDAK